MVVRDIQQKKKPLHGLLCDLYLVKPLKKLVEKERQENDCRRLQSLDLSITSTFIDQKDRYGLNLSELVSTIKNYQSILSEQLLDISLDKLMAKVQNLKEKDPLVEKLCHHASKLCQTIALESERNLIPAIGDHLQAAASQNVFSPQNTLRQTLQSFINQVSQ